MTSRALAVVALMQLAIACKNCVPLGKEERAMFLAHSAECQRVSGADVDAAAALARGALPATPPPALRRHLYCVLLRCKIISKDGKLLKSPRAGKLAKLMDRNTTKEIERCAEQAGSAASPDEVAWNLFRCAYDRKAALLDLMPPADPAAPM